MVTAFSIDGVESIETLVVRGVDRSDTGDTIVNSSEADQTLRYSLPLSLSSDSTGFVIIANGVSDTLFIKHTMDIHFVSEECGFAPQYVISTIRYSPGIDSVKISDVEVNTQSIDKLSNDDQNITLYFNPTVH